jgi:hypothetical protein
MYTPYARAVDQAQPDAAAHEPCIDKRIRLLARLAGRPYLYQFIGNAGIELEGNTLLESFARAFNGESRCIAAFLHPNGAEPQILEYFTMFHLKKYAKKAGISCAIQPHLRFVHGYEVLRWGGALARFILPRVGAMPVYHSKIDSRSMERIYRALIEGPYPLAIAPEGQVSYFSNRIPHVEHGVARIGFTAMERMKAKIGGRCPNMEILPVSVRYCFDERGRRAMKKLIRETERCIGIGAGAAMTETAETKAAGTEDSVAAAFLRCREHILRKNEERCQIPGGGTFVERVDALIERCLSRAEAILGVARRGAEDVFVRMYYLRQICWDRIFVAGKKSLADLPRLDRSLLDLAAGEAWHASRYLETVDFVYYLRAAPVADSRSSLRCQIEYAQNMWDFANRTMGGVFGTRRLIYPRRVIITSAEPINLRDYYETYCRNKKEAVRAAMDSVTARFAELTARAEER